MLTLRHERKQIHCEKLGRDANWRITRAHTAKHDPYVLRVDCENALDCGVANVMDSGVINFDWEKCPKVDEFKNA